MRSSAATSVALLPLLALAACGGASGSTSAAGGSDIAVTSSNSTCEVARTALDPGKVTFAVLNSGNDVTEVYVYGKGAGGAFDKVIGEVENIAPGTSRSFPVTFVGGEYQVACKPGQKGDGIRTTVTVSGAVASPVAAAYDREVDVTAKEFAFTGLAGFSAKVGEKIELKLKNAGTTQHELEILDPSGNKLGEVGPTDVGKTGEVVLAFTKPGTYTYLCGLADHAGRGMKGTFVVR